MSSLYQLAEDIGSQDYGNQERMDYKSMIEHLSITGARAIYILQNPDMITFPDSLAPMLVGMSQAIQTALQNGIIDSYSTSGAVVPTFNARTNMELKAAYQMRLTALSQKYKNVGCYPDPIWATPIGALAPQPGEIDIPTESEAQDYNEQMTDPVNIALSNMLLSAQTFYNDEPDKFWVYQILATQNPIETAGENINIPVEYVSAQTTPCPMEDVVEKFKNDLVSYKRLNGLLNLKPPAPTPTVYQSQRGPQPMPDKYIASWGQQTYNTRPFPRQINGNFVPRDGPGTVNVPNMPHYNRGNTAIANWSIPGR
jgi:hypothetical protein